MQLTMNDDQATVSAAKVNRFGDWIHNVTQKVTSLFKKPKKETPKFTYTTVTDAIKFIEWRTWYDQQRIVQYIYTVFFQKDNPELYKALNMSLPIKYITQETIADNRLFDWSSKSNRTREILIETGDWKNSMNVNVKLTLADSSFERRLLKYFGNLNPETQTILDGGETKAQKQPRTIEFEKMFQNNIRKGSQATDSYKARLLQEFTLVLSAIQVEIDETEIEQQFTLVALPAAEETVEVVAETLPIEEATIAELQVTEQLPVDRVVVKTKSFSKKMTIKELKVYASEHGIHVPGRKTKHRDIFEHIKAQQRAKA